ncbi:MAG: glycosyltransferase [Oscillospiraceae bacterium]
MFTCGGTGGHINPAIAVANLLRERKPDSRILFVGGAGGMECTLVPKAGFQLETLDPGVSAGASVPKPSGTISPALTTPLFLWGRPGGSSVPFSRM